MPKTIGKSNNSKVIASKNTKRAQTEWPISTKDAYALERCHLVQRSKPNAMKDMKIKAKTELSFYRISNKIEMP